MSKRKRAAKLTDRKGAGIVPGPADLPLQSKGRRKIRDAARRRNRWHATHRLCVKKYGPKRFAAALGGRKIAFVKAEGSGEVELPPGLYVPPWAQGPLKRGKVWLKPEPIVYRPPVVQVPRQVEPDDDTCVLVDVKPVFSFEDYKHEQRKEQEASVALGRELVSNLNDCSYCGQDKDRNYPDRSDCIRPGTTVARMCFVTPEDLVKRRMAMKNPKKETKGELCYLCKAAGHSEYELRYKGSLKYRTNPYAAPQKDHGGPYWCVSPHHWLPAKREFASKSTPSPWIHGGF